MQGELLQIGEAGLFVACERPPPNISGLHVRFCLPGSVTEHEVLVEVRNFIDKGKFRGAPGISGIGCSVSRMELDTKEQVAAHVRQMKHIFSQLQFALALNKRPPQFDAWLSEVGLESLRKDPKELKYRVDLMLRQLG